MLYKWSTDQTSRLVELRKSGMSADKIAKEMKISRNAVLGKLLRLGMLGKAKTPTKRKVPPVRAFDVRPAAPEDIFADRHARNMAPRTITSQLLGDPPPGWSALDRKRQGDGLR